MSDKRKSEKADKPATENAAPNTAPRPVKTEADRQKRRRIVVMLAALGLLLAAAAPYRQYYASKQRIRSLKQQEAALDRKIADLQQAHERLGTDAEVERRARELGYIRPGEVPFVIVGP